MSITVRGTDATPATSGYAELAREIRRLGLQRRRPGFYTVLLIANLMVPARIGFSATTPATTR